MHNAMIPFKSIKKGSTFPVSIMEKYYWGTAMEDGVTNYITVAVHSDHAGWENETYSKAINGLKHFWGYSKMDHDRVMQYVGNNPQLFITEPIRKFHFITKAS